MRFVLLALLMLPVPSASAQTMAVLQGRVIDPSGAAVPGASIRVRDPATGFEGSGHSDGDGRYHVAAIPPGIYQVTIEIAGFRTVRIEALTLEVGRTLVRDFELAIDTQREAVVVRAELPLLDRATSTVGHVVSAQTVQQIPLNGRHFVDLGPLVPGSVAPSQTGFSTTPIRGTGALAFNTTGNREEAVGYIVNGVTTNNLTFGSIGFPPPVASIQEFKIDNSTFSAEYGHVSGAIVNLVTRAGTDQFRGEAYEFFRNDALDARNFFEFNTDGAAPVRAQPVRRHRGRPDPSRPHVLLRHLRRPAAAPGHRHERRGAERRAADRGHRPGRQPADAADSARQLFRCRRHAALCRRGQREGRREHLDRRCAASRRHARSHPRLFRAPADYRRRADLARHQHPRIRPAPRDHQGHADGERNAHVRRRAC